MKNQDPAILFVKPGSIGEGDIAVLKHIGVTVIQVADPSSVKFTRATMEISGNDMLAVAIGIINNTNFCGSPARDALSRAVGAAITAQIK